MAAGARSSRSRGLIAVVALLLTTVAAVVAAPPAGAKKDKPIVVTTESDVAQPDKHECRGNGKKKPDSPPGQLGCSLRAAMLEANAHGGRERIVFDIPGPGVKTIVLVAPLPIVGDVDIDGRTQPGWSGSPVIQIDAAGGGGGPAFELTDDVELRGLAVYSSPGVGIAVAGSRNVVEDNHVGTDAAGAVAKPNFDGVLLTGPQPPAAPSGGNVVAGNVLSGNAEDGVLVTDGSAGNTIEGNLIGVAADGISPLGNVRTGITLSSSDNVIDGNVIGSNGRFGVFISSVPEAVVEDTVITRNAIGTDAGGTVDLGNVNSGVHNLGGHRTIVGGAPGLGNTIAFNGQRGILLSSVGAPMTSNTVSYNTIRNNDGFGVNILAQGGPPPNPHTGSRVSANSIHDNGPPGPNGRGINVGANANANATPPTIALGATSSPTQTVASGTVTAPAGTVVTIELFSNLVCDAPATVGGEGRTFLGSTSVTATGGPTPWTATVAPSVGLLLSATATWEPVGNTSRFSTCAPVVPIP